MSLTASPVFLSGKGRGRDGLKTMDAVFLPVRIRWRENVYRGEGKRAKSFGSALTHFLRGSVKRAHFATAKLISSLPLLPRDSILAVFSLLLSFLSLFRQTQWPRGGTTRMKRDANFWPQTSRILDDRGRTCKSRCLPRFFFLFRCVFFSFESQR